MGQQEFKITTEEEVITRITINGVIVISANDCVVSKTAINNQLGRHTRAKVSNPMFHGIGTKVTIITKEGVKQTIASDITRDIERPLVEGLTVSGWITSHCNCTKVTLCGEIVANG